MLERPSHDDVQLAVYFATREKDHPNTLADVNSALGGRYYMHELSRATWQLADKGTIAVRSGYIKNIEEL